MRNFLRWLIRSLVHLLTDMEVRGYENLPPTKNYLLATNHIGIIDGIMPFVALNRWDIYIPVAEKWEQNWFLNWLGRYFNFIFIDRFNPDIKAMRKIIHLMEAGQRGRHVAGRDAQPDGGIDRRQAGRHLPGEQTELPDRTHRSYGNGR